MTYGQLSPQFVTKELVSFYRRYADNPQYQRATLEVWEISAKSCERYAGAYEAAVREIRSVNQ